MIRNQRILLAGAWIVTLGVAWYAGVQRGASVRLSNQEAQVRALVDTAYPPTPRTPGATHVPPAKVAEAIEAHKTSPEVVRAVLYEENQRELWKAYEDMNMQGLTPASVQMLKDNAAEYERRLVAIRAWKPEIGGKQ